MTRKCGSATTPVGGYARPPALFAERVKCDLGFQTVCVHCTDIRHNKRQTDQRFHFLPF
jgi:hypothetical protein